MIFSETILVKNIYKYHNSKFENAYMNKSVVMKQKTFFAILLLIGSFFPTHHFAQSPQAQLEFPNAKHDLHFKAIPKVWDEGLPLGNGMLGALIWQKNKSLRISLDRADLWDSRTQPEFERPEFKFSWVKEQVENNNYKAVQNLFDEPYDREAIPTKLPPAALEFSVPQIEKVKSVELSLKDAVCKIVWKNKIAFTSFVDASAQHGWFKFENVNAKLIPRLLPPQYSQKVSSKDNSISGPAGNDLAKLGYSAPRIKQEKNQITYHQECAGGFFYDVKVIWTYSNKTLYGIWTIITNRPYSAYPTTEAFVAAPDNFSKDFDSHKLWWNNFWSKSSVQLQDSLLETQYYRELYKFGSASRKGAPPISLQAVWTADNGKLPPWKGDFHNDLNTQMSYWAGYSSNHLEESSVFTDWLWKCKPAAEEYTKKYFGTEGLNFPGVTTLDGKPMGGWIQYSLGPTVSAWLANHFYLQWRYSMDKNFLEQRAYPWIKETAIYLDQISERDENKLRKLPLSSSPEIHDNSINAWFNKTTNFDLSLIRWLYTAASEMADSLNLKEESAKWKNILNEWPDLSRYHKYPKLLVAPGVELKESHRHFSHLISIYPLGLLDWNKGGFERQTVNASVADLYQYGTGNWCGYSFSWIANVFTRLHNGRRAAEMLRIFAKDFCSPNSFHLNGDQSKSGYSNFTYRPFTLEGNFAFASAIQEMLLQSYNGIIRIFPAMSMPNASFRDLRAEGAFLVSAEKKGGNIEWVKIYSEKGGKIKIQNPFEGKLKINGVERYPAMNDQKVFELETKPGETLELKK